MRATDITLFSGGARGAESAFGQMAEKYGMGQINFTFEGHHINRSINTRSLGPADLAKSDVSMAEVSKRLGRDYSTRPWMRKILQSIWYQVNSGYQVFVVGAIQDDATVKGGTGWAVELAKMFNRPLHVFDQEKGQWFTWKDQAWAADEPVITHKTICGTGTRKINDAGREAVEALFAKTFNGG